MPVTRREFIGSSAALAAALTRLRPDLKLDAQATASDAETLFRRSLIFDALSADEDWNDPEPIFAGYKTANLSAMFGCDSSRSH